MNNIGFVTINSEAVVRGCEKYLKIVQEKKARSKAEWISEIIKTEQPGFLAKLFGHKPIVTEEDALKHISQSMHYSWGYYAEVESVGDNEISARKLLKSAKLAEYENIRTMQVSVEALNIIAKYI